MRYDGYAFRENEEALEADIKTRYDEIKHLRDKISFEVASHYAHNRFTASFEGDADELGALSELDILILADYGNLCFGGECRKTSTGFVGSYNTD